VKTGISFRVLIQFFDFIEEEYPCLHRWMPISTELQRIFWINHLPYYRLIHIKLGA